MKFRLIKEVDGSVPTYDGSLIRTGDTIELEGHFAEKAAHNPDYAIVRAEVVAEIEPVAERVSEPAKRGPGRPRKVA